MTEVNNRPGATPYSSSEMLRTIMYIESSCDITKRVMTMDTAGVRHEHCGLMQLDPAVANQYITECGQYFNFAGGCRSVNGRWVCNPGTRITCDQLTSPAYAQASICLAGANLDAIYGNPDCGKTTQFRSAFAAYNGGTQACAVSTDCQGEQGCDLNPVKRWECPYDDGAHTQCNVGFKETRDYVRKGLACIAEFAGVQ